jgi:cupin 2 domain-containing protein
MGPDGNLLSGLPAGLKDEFATELAEAGAARIERIVSPPGHSSPDGFWYDQPHAEWVAVLAGSAGLLFEGEPEPRRLGPGDYVLIPRMPAIGLLGRTLKRRRCGWPCICRQRP